jgi:hypothetical protein
LTSREVKGQWGISAAIHFNGQIVQNLQRNAAIGIFVYLLRATKAEHFGPRKKRIGDEEMREAKDVVRIVGMILLGVFVFAVGVPLVFALAGVTLGVIGFLIHLAVMLIKLAVVLAVGYLILVGIRALLR